MSTSTAANPGPTISNDRPWPLIVLAFLVVLLFAVAISAMAALVAGPYMGWSGMGSYGGTGWGWMGALGLALVLLFVLLPVAFFLAVLRRPSGGSAPEASAPSSTLPPSALDPLGVVRLRYARGELTREQYHQMASDLGPKS